MLSPNHAFVKHSRNPFFSVKSDVPDLRALIINGTKLIRDRGRISRALTPALTGDSMTELDRLLIKSKQIELVNQMRRLMDDLDDLTNELVATEENPPQWTAVSS